MGKYNKKQSEQLEMAHGTACGVLNKQILFAAIQQLGQDVCYRCDEKIVSIDEFSIDHKIPWIDSDNPRDLFFDLDNIAFSHLGCNIRASRGNSKLTEEAVKEIRQTHKNTKALAEKFGVCISTISRVRLGDTWKHIGT